MSQKTLHAAALMLLAASLCPAAAPGQSAREPRFQDYPAGPVYRGRVARVVLDADGRAFRTRLREAAKGRPNFAGRYIVTGWGCGTGCLLGAVIDAKTGRVHWFPHAAYADYDAPPDFEPVRFRLDSRLFVIFGARDENSEDDEMGTHYYEFTGGRFKRVRFVPKARRE